jgi:hypothetical protein
VWKKSQMVPNAPLQGFWRDAVFTGKAVEKFDPILYRKILEQSA